MARETRRAIGASPQLMRCAGPPVLAAQPGWVEERDPRAGNERISIYVKLIVAHLTINKGPY